MTARQNPLTASGLRAWRNRMGWGRDEAAAQLNVKRDTYKKLENGQRPVTARLMAEARRLEKTDGGKITPRADEKAAVHVVGGGTVVHVRNHLALAAPAYGSTARELAGGYGNVFERTLAPGESIQIEPGSMLYKDASVTLQTEAIKLSSGIFGGTSMYLARLTGPGRVGIQSMYHHHESGE